MRQPILNENPDTVGKVAEAHDEFDETLHGSSRAGQHAGPTEIRTYTAFDLKDLHEKMSGFDNGELKRIPILAHGEMLEQGASYLDLSDDSREIFTAQGGMEAQDPHLYVPKAKVDYELWNKIIGRNTNTGENGLLETAA